MDVEGARPAAVGKIHAVTRSGRHQDVVQVHPSVNPVQLRPNSKGLEQGVAPLGRNQHSGRCPLMAASVGGEPRHETRHVIGMAVGEEHGLLRREQRRTPSNVHCGPVGRDDEGSRERRYGRADEFEAGAGEAEFVRCPICRLRKFHQGLERQGSTVMSDEARTLSGSEPTYLTSKVPGLKGAANDRGFPAVV